MRPTDAISPPVITNEQRAQKFIAPKTYLSKNFSPDAWSVVCGRGKECYDSIGNRRFRVLIDIYFPKYFGASARSDKSKIVTDIVDTIRCGGGGFVKHDSRRNLWYEIGDDLAREKVGNQFRVAMSSQSRTECKKLVYKSTTKPKCDKISTSKKGTGPTPLRADSSLPSNQELTSAKHNCIPSNIASLHPSSSGRGSPVSDSSSTHSSGCISETGSDASRSNSEDTNVISFSLSSLGKDSLDPPKRGVSNCSSITIDIPNPTPLEDLSKYGDATIVPLRDLVEEFVEDLLGLSNTFGDIIETT